MATDRPDAPAAPPSEGSSAASDDVLSELSSLGAGLAKQALETGQMVLKSGRTADLGPGDILRCSQWAATLQRPKKKMTLPLPREAFLPPTE